MRSLVTNSLIVIMLVMGMIVSATSEDFSEFLVGIVVGYFALLWLIIETREAE